MTLDQVRKRLLRAAKPFAVYRGSTGVRGWCIAHSVHAPHVSEFMNGKRPPAPDLLEALGLEWRVMRKAAHSSPERQP